MSIVSKIKGLFGSSSKTYLSEDEYNQFKENIVTLAKASHGLAILMTRFKWDRQAAQDPELVATARRRMREVIDLEDKVTQTVVRFIPLPDVDQPKLTAQDCASQMVNYTMDLSGVVIIYGDDAVIDPKTANRVSHIHKLSRQLIGYLAS